MANNPVIVVGAGAAGLAAAIAAAQQKVPVIVLEKGPKPARKILVSGAGRCNLTNQQPAQMFIDHYFGKGRFLFPAFNLFFRDQLLELLRSEGVATITEPNGKIFPASGRALDVAQALSSLARKAGADIRLNQTVRGIRPAEDHIDVSLPAGQLAAAAVIMACGGKSWPATGSSGDGYRMAEALGLTIVPIRPGLTGFHLDRPIPETLQGVSCSDISARLLQGSRLLGRSRGECLLTHFGLSGPAILRLSRDCPADWPWQDPVILEIDWLPDRKAAHLEEDIRQACRLHGRRQLHNALADSLPLPQALIRWLMTTSGLSPDQTAADISRQSIETLVHGLKSFQLPVSRTRGFQDAMVTAGGVSLREIDPRTMACHRWPRLFFAGEILDIDGDTGGYNLQAAFSTGWLAGREAARLIRSRPL